MASNVKSTSFTEYKNEEVSPVWQYFLRDATGAKSANAIVIKHHDYDLLNHLICVTRHFSETATASTA